MKITKDMPHLVKKMERIDRKRLQRLKEAKETRSFKQMIDNIAHHEIKNAYQPKQLTQLQKNAIYLMSDFSHNFSYDYIATRLGIDIRTLKEWRNDPTFIKEMDKEVNVRRNFARISAFRNVFRAISHGSLKDSWKYLEMTGDLKKGIELTDNTGEKEMSDDEISKRIKELVVEMNGQSTSVN